MEPPIDFLILVPLYLWSDVAKTLLNAEKSQTTNLQTRQLPEEPHSLGSRMYFVHHKI